MSTRRSFIISLSLGSLASAVKGKPAVAQEEADIVNRLVVDQVYDLSSIPDLDPEKVHELSEIVVQNLGRQFLENNLDASDNCGCNAVCTCNSDRNSCCENKCACHSKSAMGLQMEELIITSPYQDLVRNFNPQETNTFNQALIGVLQLPKYGGVGVGISDTGAPLEPGTYTADQLRSEIYSSETIDGTPISEQVILQQFNGGTE